MVRLTSICQIPFRTDSIRQVVSFCQKHYVPAHSEPASLASALRQVSLAPDS